jgi:hypothetical protein
MFYSGYFVAVQVLTVEVATVGYRAGELLVVHCILAMSSAPPKRIRNSLHDTTSNSTVTAKWYVVELRIRY